MVFKNTLIQKFKISILRLFTTLYIQHYAEQHLELSLMYLQIKDTSQ